MKLVNKDTENYVLIQGVLKDSVGFFLCEQITTAGRFCLLCLLYLSF